MNGTETIAEAGPYSYTSPHDGNAHMTATLIGYARCSTDRQGPAAQRQALLELGVVEDRIYTDHGLTGTTRTRPGLDPALAAVRARTRSTTGRPGPSQMRAPSPTGWERGVKLALGRALYDPGDPILFFHILATFAEFEADLIRMRTREGMAIARARGKCAASSPNCPTAAGTLPHACHRRVFHQRSRRTLLRLKTNRLSHTQPTPLPLAYDPAPYRNRPAHLVGDGAARRLGPEVPRVLRAVSNVTSGRIWIAKAISPLRSPYSISNLS